LREEVILPPGSVTFNTEIALSRQRRGGEYWVAYNKEEMGSREEIFVARLDPSRPAPRQLSDSRTADVAKHHLFWGGDIEWIYSERGSRNDLIRVRFTPRLAFPIEQVVIDAEEDVALETLGVHSSACPVLDANHPNFGRFILVVRSDLPRRGPEPKRIALVTVKERPPPPPFSEPLEAIGVNIFVPLRSNPKFQRSGGAEWSPDGFMYTFVVPNADGDGSNLFVAVYDRNAPNDGLVRYFQLTRQEGREDQTKREAPAWSDDGRFLLYARRETGMNQARRLFLIDVGRLLPVSLGAYTPGEPIYLSGVIEEQVTLNVGQNEIGSWTWRPHARPYRVAYSIRQTNNKYAVFESVLNIQ
jgi:hypothetical protein